ncbi:MAG TPA: Cys-tRNA(Pro) deacylase [Clostridiales bacterium]|nr:Cys-tRNA(Pro) deacylase [Clostridiales bacterium]
MNKTNVMRLLEQAGIPYKAIEYEVDENNLSGEHVADLTHMPPEQVFKTLVAKGERKGYVVFCIPVNMELDLKKAASIIGDKKIEMLHVKDLLGTTGYIRGGCSPIGMKKKFPTYFDETAILYEEIAVSAGVRGCQLCIPGDKLIEYVDAALCDLTA